MLPRAPGLTLLRRGIAVEAARAYDAAARAIRGPNARTNFAYDETQPQPVRAPVARRRMRRLCLTRPCRRAR